MNGSFRTGMSFGVTSGVITTLGLMVGLESGTNSQLAVIGGILVIAVADALSDALGIHISEESENVHTSREVWESTLATFFSKLILASTFVIPVLFLELSHAVLVSIVWGLLLLSVLSLAIAKNDHKQPLGVITEHLFIAVLVIIVTHYIGELVANIFG